MPYIDPQTIHNPATGTVAPASWGDTVRDDLEFLVDPPACSVYHSTTQNTTTATELFPAADTEAFDNDAMHSTVTNTGRITFQTAGRYMVIATVSWEANSTGRRATEFRVNGSTILSGVVGPATPVASGLTLQTATRLLVAAAGDYIECRLFQNSGATLTIDLKEFAALYLTR